MLWVKGTVLTLIERSQPLCWPHCLQCRLETAPRSRASGAKVLENTRQNRTGHVCLLQPFPSFVPVSHHVPQGWAQQWHQVSWLGSLSHGMGCRGLPAVPRHAPSPIVVPSISHPHAESRFPLSQQPWRQCSSSCAPCWCRQPWQMVGAKCFPHAGDGRGMGKGCRGLKDSHPSDPRGWSGALGSSPMRRRVPALAGGYWGCRGSARTIIHLPPLVCFFQWPPKRRRRTPLTMVSITVHEDGCAGQCDGEQKSALNPAGTSPCVFSPRLPEPEDRRAGVCRGPVHCGHSPYTQ